ncbi:hypothetical protein L0F63_006062 [Massospora cicadina]|nr:hypothetical protein L0F63_006062 [Massospora cicadina]
MKFATIIAFAASVVYCADSTNTTLNGTTPGLNSTNSTAPKSTGDASRTPAAFILAAGAFVVSNLW